MSKSMRQYTYEKQQQVNEERNAWQDERAEIAASAERAEAEELSKALHDRTSYDDVTGSSNLFPVDLNEPAEVLGTLAIIGCIIFFCVFAVFLGSI